MILWGLLRLVFIMSRIRYIIILIIMGILREDV
jgi:hypothetical protein